MDSSTTIQIGDRTFEIDADSLEKICDLGRGAYGIVEKMRHEQTGTVMAVKRITATVNRKEQKRLLMDLDISMRSSDCPYTVHFYGALFREGDVWICMEVMDTSLDKFYPKVFKNNLIMEESVLGKVSPRLVYKNIAFSTDFSTFRTKIYQGTEIINVFEILIISTSI